MLTLKSKCLKLLLTTKALGSKCKEEEGGCWERLESVALLVCPTTAGTQELQTPHVRMDEGILGICRQMANQCFSWKTKESLGSFLWLIYVFYSILTALVDISVPCWLKNVSSLYILISCFCKPLFKRPTPKSIISVFFACSSNYNFC